MKKEKPFTEGRKKNSERKHSQTNPTKKSVKVIARAISREATMLVVKRSYFLFAITLLCNLHFYI